MQQVVVIPHLRFGTTYRSLKMIPTRCPETSVRNYHYLLCNYTEERSSHLLHGGSLKSHKVLVYVYCVCFVFTSILTLDQACLNCNVLPVTLAKSGLHAGNMKLNTQNVEQRSIGIIICIILPVHSPIHHVR